MTRFSEELMENIDKLPPEDRAHAVKLFKMFADELQNMRSSQGPWHIEIIDRAFHCEEPGVAVVDANGNIVADNKHYYPEALDPGNAHLIAAAPEMLALLEELFARAERPWWDVGVGMLSCKEIQELVLPVIKKAWGEE